MTTSVELTVTDGENTILDDSAQVAELMPGDKWTIEFRTSDTSRHPIPGAPFQRRRRPDRAS